MTKTPEERAAELKDALETLAYFIDEFIDDSMLRRREMSDLIIDFANGKIDLRTFKDKFYESVPPSA